MSNKERLNELINNRRQLLPLIHDILAEQRISDRAFAEIFYLLNYSMAECPDCQVSYSKETKEWRLGKAPLSDLRLFCMLKQVCDIVDAFIKSSWEECILSSWIPLQDELTLVDSELRAMENIVHIKTILKLSSEKMIYTSDGTLNWHEDKGGSE